MLDPTLAVTVADKLTARRHTVAVAEGSCGGPISAALLAVPGASRYFDDRSTNMIEFTKAAIALLDECLGPSEPS